MKVSQTGVGFVEFPERLPVGPGGWAAIQVHSSDAATTYQIETRLDTSAPWVSSPSFGGGPQTSADFTQVGYWAPHWRLNVTAGIGTVDAYIAEPVN